jgi:flagellin
MRINTNNSALNASHQIFVNQVASEGSMRKLSSGLRIARAADDAAGLAIANKLRTQSRSLNQAASNADQGCAMLQIAEGGANTIQRIIERQKELITQKLNASSDSTTSATIEAEITTLSAEVSRIANSTTFLGTTVLSSLTFQVADVSINGILTVNASLTVSTVSLVGTATLAQADSAMDAINSVLTSIGAGQNRLDFTQANLKSSVVNIRAAESTVRDVNMAEEMASFTRNKILSQAAQAMMSQANQSTESVLSLLK